MIAGIPPIIRMSIVAVELQLAVIAVQVEHIEHAIGIRYYAKCHP